MNIEHPDYQQTLPLWTKVRDVVAGEERVKAKSTTYLPRLASQKQAGNEYARESYENYLMRASFYGAPGRTVQGLTGAILRKEPSIEGVPDGDLRDIQDALGVNHEAAQSLAMEQLNDLVSVGRYVLLIEKSGDPESKPYALKFAAEDVPYWVESEIDGRMTLTTVIIAKGYECRDESDPMGVRVETKTEYLVLRLGVVPEHWSTVPGFEGFAGAPTDRPIYWQETWREKGGTAKRKLAKDGTLGDKPHHITVPTKMGGRWWHEIPCDIVNAAGGITAKVERPPMLALANVILAHYRGSADLEWGRHMTAIPQPWVSGFDLRDDDQLVVGCGYAWSSRDPAAKVGYLEFTGAGLGHIADGQKEKEKQAAVLGARMLEEQSNVAEAMGTVRLRQSGDRSILAVIAHNVSEAMTRAVQRYLAWQYPAFDSVESLRGVSYDLASDFDSTRLDPAELAALTQSLQAGTMSWETFAHNMRRGEMLPPGVTDEEELERIREGSLIRKTDTVALMLQADVREGRISQATYLAEIQKLGLLAGVDLKGEADRVFEDRMLEQSSRMQSFMQQTGPSV